jgi:hypothetical protein
MKIYRNITWPVVLFGYETWSLTLREQHRLRVFEKRVKGKAIPVTGRGGP